MATNSPFNHVSQAALVLVAVVAILALPGCPAKKYGTRQKINMDSVVKANKAIADSAVKIAPTVADTLSIDSLRARLRVGPAISNAVFFEWISPDLTIPPEDGSCPLVAVDFSDHEVSQLYTRVSAQFPSQINIMIGQMGAPLYSGQAFFPAPNVWSNPCEPSLSADWVPYSLTAAQRSKWNSTLPNIKNLFIGALNAFNWSAGVANTQNVLRITNLGYSGLSTAPYTGVNYTVTNYNANTRIHVIQLLD